MKPDDDDALRAALAEAHHADAARMPSFEQAWDASRPGRHPRPSRLAWVMTCATLATATGLSVWFVGRPGTPPAQFPVGTGWRGPTDFLLETPDVVTLRTVPNLVTTFPDPVSPPDSDTRRGNP
jgi:hypothetical protein